MTGFPITVRCRTGIGACRTCEIHPWNHGLSRFGEGKTHKLYSNPQANVDKYLITFAGFYLFSISPAKFNTGLKHGMGKCEEKQLGHFLFWVKYGKIIWTSSRLKPIVWLSRRLFGSNVNPKHKTWLIYIYIFFFLRGLVKSKFIIFFIFPFYTSGQVPCKKPFSTWIFPWIFSKASTIRYAEAVGFSDTPPLLPLKIFSPSLPVRSWWQYSYHGKECGYINNDMLMDDLIVISLYITYILNMDKHGDFPCVELQEGIHIWFTLCPFICQPRKAGPKDVLRPPDCRYGMVLPPVSRSSWGL